MTHLSDIVASNTSLPAKGVIATIRLLDEGATIPFISRYRKEATGELDEVAVAAIEKELRRLRELEQRKQYILETIEQAGKLTTTLQSAIIESWDSKVIEDLFAPYKPHKSSRADKARALGLEPLAAIIMAQNTQDTLNSARRFAGKPEVPDAATAISGAKDIIAEWISDNARVRGRVRNITERMANMKVSIAKGKEEEGANYRNYADFSRPLRNLPSHNYLAIKRGEREGILKVNITADTDKILDTIESLTLKSSASPSTRSIISEAIADGYKRLLRPSLDSELNAETKKRADAEAIALFAANLRQLLMAAPLGSKRVLAIDPGFRTGCKVVCLERDGSLRYHTVIYPCAPRNDRQGAETTLRHLVAKYEIEAIAIGNGTAGRETETFVRSLFANTAVDVHSVSESGASVYSASAVAREEFPNEDVTVRGAVSIGRRLLDPLAELVKIDPASIGVGQYQHDVDHTALKEALDFTVTSCVNHVGVNVNTASPQLLSYVAGVGPAMAKKIVEYRSEHGMFTSRRQLLKVPRLGEKTFAQCAGFLRIPGTANPLDNTAVHPKDYNIVERMAKDLNCSVSELAANSDMIDSIDITRYVSDDRGLPTLRDIIAELRKPGRDPRTVEQTVDFAPEIASIEDLKPGMILTGIVNNITAFGAFVDIGIKQSGLVHLSQMSDRYVSSPAEVVRLQQTVTVKVLDIDMNRKRISLSMKGLSNS